MLVDLLEKSVDVKEPPVLNGGLSCKDLCISERGLELISKGPKSDLGKQIRITERGLEVVDTATGGTEKELVGMELRLTERGLELVDKQGEAPRPAPAVPQDNVLQKELLVGEKLLEFLEKQDGNLEDEIMLGPEGDLASSLKRPAGDVDDKNDVKRLRLEVNGNGSNSGDESSQGEEKVKASSAAANLYSALAASILDDDEEETLMQPVPETSVPVTVPVKEEPVENTPQPQMAIADQSVAQISTQPQPQLQLVQSGGTLRQVYVSSDPNQAPPSQQVMMAGTRQIIVSQGRLCYVSAVCSLNYLNSPLINFLFVSSHRSESSTDHHCGWLNSPAGRHGSRGHHYSENSLWTDCTHVDDHGRRR